MDFDFLVKPMMVALASAVALLGPGVLYVVARWRAHREQHADPQIGLKLALYWFATIAFHTALVGGTLLIYTMIRPLEKSTFGLRDEMVFDPKSAMYRAAFGLLVPAAIVLGGSLIALMRTNDAQQTTVRRLFFGFNLLLVGIIGFGALVLGFQALFAKGSTDGMGHLGGAAILVYGTAWAVLGWRHYTMVVGTTHVFQDPPDIVPPPGPMLGASTPQPKAGASTSGLPSLGSAYPPIEPKD